VTRELLIALKVP